MTCTEIKTIVDSWEHDGTISSEQWESLQRHTEDCDRCSGQYSSLLPLMARDAGEAIAFNVIEPTADASPLPSLAPHIMDRIRDERPNPRTVRTARPAIIAAAAVLIAVSGFVTYYSAYLRPTVLVQFTLEAPAASSVHLVGDFNGWDTGDINLSDDDNDGVWSARVRLRRDEIHTYNFVIDAETWIADPESLFNIDDGFGSLNSMLKL